MKRLLLAAGFTLLLASPAQAQTQITISCTAVTVRFQTSIQPETAVIEIVSNAGTETHPVTLAQGGTPILTFPLDGQNGEVVTVTVTAMYRGDPNVTTQTQTLEGCDETPLTPSPSPTVPLPTPSVEAGASPVASPVVVAPVATTPPPAIVVEEPEEAVESSAVAQPDLPAELAYTGPGRFPGLLILAVSLIGLGFYARGKGYRNAR